MIIPIDQLSEEALNGLMEEFISREGTEYGSRSYSMDEMLAQVKSQLDSAEVLVVFDAETSTCNLVRKDELQRQELELQQVQDRDGHDE